MGTTGLAVGATVLALAGYLRAAEALDRCKAVASDAIVESPVFTPYELRRTNGMDRVPILTGEESASPPDFATFRVAEVAGLDRRHTFALPNGSVYGYFHDQPIVGLTVAEFRRQGGIQLDQDPRDGNLPFSEALLKQFPTRVTVADVGQFDGVITWGDPDENGVRTHNVYWSDSDFNYSLITTEKSAAEALNLARSLVC